MSERQPEYPPEYDDCDEREIAEGIPSKNLVPGDQCPGCRHPLEFEKGHQGEYDDPGQDPLLYCTECGCESYSIDWDSWKQEKGIFWRLTDEQRKQIDALEHKIDECYPKPTKDDAPTWKEMFEHTPEEDFEFKQEEAGDWTPWRDDDPVGWTQTSYLYNIGRTNGKRWIEFMSVDRDGNWETDCRIEDDEDGDPPQDAEKYLVMMHPHHHLRAVAEYYVYVAETGDDCLDDYYYPKKMNPEKAIESLRKFIR